MTEGLDPALERRIAVDLFNYVWTLLERPDRSVADDDEMLHAAHASRHHWGQIGTPENLERGEWQVSHVYSVLGRAEPALYHAQRCLDICKEHRIGDWDLAFAYEALARAASVAGDFEALAKHLEDAREAATQIAEDDDREHLLKQLESIPTGSTA